MPIFSRHCNLLEDRVTRDFIYRRTNPQATYRLQNNYDIILPNAIIGLSDLNTLKNVDAVFNAMVADALAPYLARPSATTVLTT